MHFTADEAYEASLNGEPIMIGWTTAETIVFHHSQTQQAFREACGHHLSYDAWVVLEWLGY